MRKNLASWLVRFSLALVPIAAGCAADGDDGAVPTGDAVEASYEQLEARVAREDLTVKTSHVSPDGATHVRFHQLYQGVPVFEGEVITHVDKNGKVTETNALRSIKNLSTTPNISRDEAIAFARNAGPADGVAQILDAKLMVLPNGDHDSRDRLTWYVRLYSEGGADGAAQWDTFVDAHNGKLALAFDTLHTGSPTKGRTFFNGEVDLQAELSGGTYSLIDDLGNRTVDMANASTGTGTLVTTTTLDVTGAYGEFGTGTNGLTGANRLTAAADAHFGLTKTIEYYQAVLGRNGIDGLGTKTRSRVHYGSLYENAFWQDSCYCMTYGDGGTTLHPLTNLDVVGHEMSHGVMSKEAALTYRGESGGLNESNSDIFGTMVEWYVNSPSDTPDWKIGERLYKSSPTRSLRHMDKPSLDGNRSPNCWTTKLRNLDVHYSSGPNNHMFYLLAQGEDATATTLAITPTTTSECNSKPVRGIGRTKAATIWYLAVRDRFVSSTNYAGARLAVVAQAQALVGVSIGGSVVTLADVQSVRDAYAAINVN